MSKKLDTLIDMFQHTLVNYNTIFIPLYSLANFDLKLQCDIPLFELGDPLFPIRTGRAAPNS
jgi:hypothetical protein